jgi:hypothetical protein
VAWSEAARRAFYVKKYGEEEGEAKFQEWMDRQDLAAEQPRQEGSVVEPKRRSSTRKGKRKLDADTAYNGMAIAIATADKALANFLYPPWKEEQLTNEEIGRLARATGDEILQSETLTRWFLSALEVTNKGGPHARLLIAVAMIAYPRMVRRGMVPDFLPDLAGYEPPDVAGGGAHGDPGADGFGEVPLDESLAGYAEPLGSVEEQGGLGEVPEGTAHTNGRAHGRSQSQSRDFAPAIREAVAGI